MGLICILIRPATFLLVRMNTKTLSLFVFLIISSSVKAQVLVGPIVGPQVSWVSFNDKDNARRFKQKPVIGFHAGANLSFRVQKRFFLHTSLLYSEKGKLLDMKDDATFQNKAKYRYIEMPLAYTVEFITKTGTNKQFKWYLGLGPNISYLLSGKGSLRSSELDEILISPINYKMAFGKDKEEVENNEMAVREPNRLQLGLNLSSGLVFEPTGVGKFMLTLRYEFGHSFFSRDGQGILTQSSDYVDDLKVRNQGFRFSVAYLIDLKTDQKKRGKSTIRKKTFNR